MKGGLICLMTALAFLIAGTAGCSKESPVQSGPTEKKLNPTDGPGGFAMSYLKGLAKTRQASEIRSGDNVNFNLGSIKGSTAFYFLLYNVGNSPIFNVTLTVGDTIFSLYPAKIDTLAPGTDLGILPIVKVNAFHGTSFDGVGLRPLMKKGVNGATLRIAGITKTAQGRDTAVTLSVGLTIEALIMDFSFHGLGGEIDLESPSMTAMGSFLRDSSLSLAMASTWPLYYPANYKSDKMKQGTGCFADDIRDTSMRIVNTGNVPLAVTQYPSSSFPVFTASVAPGDSINVPAAAGKYIIDGNHAIADPKRMTMHTDGKCYFEFTSPYGLTCGTYFDWNAFKMLSTGSSCPGLGVSMQRLTTDTTLLYWSRIGTCADTTAVYRLYRMSPDSLVAQYKETINGPVEQYVNQTYKDLLIQLRREPN
jgi:hypothetical protein